MTNQKPKKEKRPGWMKPGDTLVTAWAEYCGGPGWANSPVWAIVRDGGHKLREVAIQPSEQTAEMLTLFASNAASSASMFNAVRRAMEGGK